MKDVRKVRLTRDALRMVRQYWYLLVYERTTRKYGERRVGGYGMYIWRWDMLPRMFICRLSRWVWDCGYDEVRCWWCGETIRDIR